MIMKMPIISPNYDEDYIYIYSNDMYLRKAKLKH